MATLPVLDDLESVEEIELSAADKLLRLAEQEGDLTGFMSESDLAELGRKAVDDYKKDKGDRGDWERIVKQALEAASQESKLEERGYPWPKASNVRYPLLTVGANQFAARAYPAIVRGDEAISVKVVGNDAGMGETQGPDGQQAWQVAPGAKAARADRIRDYLNDVLFNEVEDWESDTDALLHQLPIVGCAFRKLWYDPASQRQCAALVPALRLIAPQSTKTCRTALRLTEEIPDVSPLTIIERMRSGFYRFTDRIEWDEDYKPRLLLEQHRLIDLDEDGLPEPYVLTIDEQTGEVLRVEANFSVQGIQWDGQQVLRIERGQFYVKYEFLPHPEGKFYAIGLGHLLGHIGEVINTAINQMIDAGNAQVAGGGFIASGVRLNGSNRGSTLTMEPGKYKTVDVPGNVLREALVERTFPGASPIMFQVLEMMLGAATDISSVKDIMTGDASNNGQVGTTLALIEQGLAQFTAIYKRIHRSLREEYELLFQNIARWGGDAARQRYALVLDEQADFDADFRADDFDVRPVSDPSSVTKMQRLAKAQFLMQFLSAPGVNPQEIMKRAWEAAGIEDTDSLFMPPQPPSPVDMAQLEGVQAKTARDAAAAEKDRVQAEGQQLENIAKSFGAGQAIGLVA